MAQSRIRFFLMLALVGLAISTLVAVDATPAAADTTFVVDTTSDDGALSACTLAPGDCSLRGAIAAANATAGDDTIDFLIPAAQCPGGICPITLTNGPLEITEALTVDGTTQVQNGGPQANVCATETEPSHMRIEVVTDPTAGDASGFIIDHATGSSTIRGLALGTNSLSGLRWGIYVLDGDGHHIACNHLGADAAGTAVLGSGAFNSSVAFEPPASNVVIGTDGDGVDDLAERNVIARTGIFINANNGIRVTGNYFGYTADGTATLSSAGVSMRQSSSNNLIGTNNDGVSDDLEVNYFGGGTAVYMYPAGYATTGNKVVGNVIGMSPTGLPVTANIGVRITDFGADDTGYEITGNTIVNATGAAIDISATSSGVLVEGNYIGQTADGTAGPNSYGMQIKTNATPQVIDNLITGSTTAGIDLIDSGSLAAGSTGNCVIDNTAGVVNSTGSSVDFANNWWGAIDGPAGIGSGSGDTVSADVVFSPWRTAPGALCNTAPVASDAAFTVAEDVAVGTSVGTVAVVDDGAAFDFTITAGNTGGAFAIDSATGEITTAAALDYETTPSYSLTIDVSDGFASDTATVAVTVTDVFEVPATPTFDDVPATHTFYADVEWLAAQGITKGCNPPANNLFCPNNSVTRGQMAAFLHRALGGVLTPGAPVSFTDISGSVFTADIEWLGSVGVTKGCNPPTNDMYCPDAQVTRDQMAAFLVRALGYTAGAGSDQFTDDDGSIFEADIERLAEAGVTKGCNPPANDMFCPNAAVTRGQMAAFLHRALG